MFKNRNEIKMYSLVLIDARETNNSQHRGKSGFGSFNIDDTNIYVGIATSDRQDNSFNTFVMFNPGYDIYRFHRDFLKPISVGIDKITGLEEFINENTKIVFTDTELEESITIYPPNERLDHEILNEMNADSLKIKYPYETILLHLIKSLLCVQSLEERLSSLLKTNENHNESRGSSEQSPIESKSRNPKNVLSTKDRGNTKESIYQYYDSDGRFGILEREPLPFLSEDSVKISPSF